MFPIAVDVAECEDYFIWKRFPRRASAKLGLGKFRRLQEIASKVRMAHSLTSFIQEMSVTGLLCTYCTASGTGVWDRKPLAHKGAYIAVRDQH